MPPKKRQKRKTSARFPRFPFFRILLWAGVLLVTALTLFLVMRLPSHPPAPTTPASKPVESRPAPADRVAVSPVAPVVPPPAASANETEPAQVYEVPFEDFEAKVRDVDLAILNALTSLGQSQNIMRHRAVEARSHQGEEFFYQNLTIDLGQDVFPFLAALKQQLDQLAPEARLRTLNENPRDLEISILGAATHHLFLPLRVVPEPPEPTARKPRLVIIIDDLGGNTNTADRLARLPFPVSFSILPYNPKAVEVARIARRHNLELLLHLPCEPEGYPKVNSGPGTLRVNMSPAALEQALVENLARLPEVDGVNNHMGSRLTQDKKAMTIILAHLKGRGKFFLDSLTTPKSCVRAVSKKLGMRYYRRHVFLDNTAKEHAILLQLRKAETLAKRDGTAVAIGHPYPATLAALEAWAKNRDISVTICTLQEI